MKADNIEIKKITDMFFVINGQGQLLLTKDELQTLYLLIGKQLKKEEEKPGRYGL